MSFNKKAASDYLKHRLIIRGIITIILLLGIFGVWFTFSTPQSNSKIPELITMKDLGYLESYTEASFIQKNPNKYVLFIKNHQSEEEEDYQTIDLVMYQNDDSKQLTSLLEKEIKSVKEREITFAKDCKECSFLPKNYTSIYDYVVELDKEEWGVDQAYALYDWKNYPTNCLFQNVIFLQKNNQIMVVSFNLSFELTNDRINELQHLFEKSKNIFN